MWIYNWNRTLSAAGVRLLNCGETCFCDQKQKQYSTSSNESQCLRNLTFFDILCLNTVKLWKVNLPFSPSLQQWCCSLSGVLAEACRTSTSRSAELCSRDHRTGWRKSRPEGLWQKFNMRSKLHLEPESSLRLDPSPARQRRSPSLNMRLIPRQREDRGSSKIMKTLVSSSRKSPCPPLQVSDTWTQITDKKGPRVKAYWSVP